MRGDKCPICGTYLDMLGLCTNVGYHGDWRSSPRAPAHLPTTAPEGFAMPEKRTAPPPPGPAPASFGVPEIRGPSFGLLAAFRRFLQAMRSGGVR